MVPGPDYTAEVGLPGIQLPCEGGFLVDSRHDEMSDNLSLEDPEGGMKIPGSGV